jgi:hypothetical protein
MGLLAHVFWLSGLTLGSPPCSFLPCPGDVVPIVPIVVTNVVTLSSSDTEEALELLFLSPDRNPVSHVYEPSLSSGSDQYEDWP